LGLIFFDVAVERFSRGRSRKSRFDFHRISVIDNEIDLGFGFRPPIFDLSIRFQEFRIMMVFEQCSFVGPLSESPEIADDRVSQTGIHKINFRTFDQLGSFIGKERLQQSQNEGLFEQVQVFFEERRFLLEKRGQLVVGNNVADLKGQGFDQAQHLIIIDQAENIPDVSQEVDAEYVLQDGPPLFIVLGDYDPRVSAENDEFFDQGHEFFDHRNFQPAAARRFFVNPEELRILVTQEFPIRQGVESEG
jgi:hypothetical protein